MRYLLFLTFLAMGFGSYAQMVQKGHAHNDYLHKRPFTDAYNSGFRSMEVDVWWYDSTLVVSHTKVGLSRKPKLDSLYLMPIAAHLKKAKGKMYPPDDSTTLILMVDIKNDPGNTFNKLKEMLMPYKKYIRQWSGDSVVNKGQIEVLITGKVPRERIMADSVRMFSIDGNMKDTAAATSVKLVPRISLNWEKYFSWNGAGRMPKEDAKKLQGIIEQVHASGKTLRFWGAPDNFGLWKKLMDEGVDWINTDNLKGFTQFYLGYTTTPK
jgi:hypothetical protein